MGYLDKLEKFKAREKEDKNQSEKERLTLHDAISMCHSENKKSRKGLRIYFDILESTIWLCIDKEQASQVEQDDPEAICYTVAEIEEILSRKPNHEDLYISIR